VEREIGNVAADVGLRAFRYLSFAPVAFDVRPVPVRDEAPDAPAEVEGALSAAADAAGPPEARVGEPPWATPAHGGMPAAAQAAGHAMAPAAAPLAPESPGNAGGFGTHHAAPATPSRVPAWPPVREAFADGLPSFGFTAVAAPGGAPAPEVTAAPAPGLFAPTPVAPSFTSLAQAMPAPAFVMAAPPGEAVATASLATPSPANPGLGDPPAPSGGFAPFPPAEAAPPPIAMAPFPPFAAATMGFAAGPRPAPHSAPNPFAAQPVPPAEPAPPRLRRLAELQGEVPPARAAHPPAAAPRRYALLQDVRSELAGRAPPTPLRRDPPA
jgi:hypothetical protein